jgi:hypothetical protein
MSAKRTVDPDGEIASTRFMGLRVTTKQWYHIELLCKIRGDISKSELLRQLVKEAMDNVKEPF